MAGAESRARATAVASEEVLCGYTHYGYTHHGYAYRCYTDMALPTRWLYSLPYPVWPSMGYQALGEVRLRLSMAEARAEAAEAAVGS
jgi:hypothetical protein